MNMQTHRYRHRHRGFTLPVVLIASIVMLAGLVTAASAVTVSRTALDTQYYESIARTTAESGLIKAEACLNNSNNQVGWTAERPLRPHTSCTGAALSGGNNDAQWVMQTDNLRATFTVGEVQTEGGVHVLQATGTVYLLRSSDGAVWREYQNTQALSINYQSVMSSMTSTGAQQTCTIANGRTWCWGSNHWGHLGDGTLNDSLEPVQVVRSSGLGNKQDTHVANGNFTSCIVSSGEVWCWGRNSRGELGFASGGEETANPNPRRIQGSLINRTAIQVEVGARHVCALTSAGEVWCWGDNGQGQIGHGGSVASTPLPQRVGGALLNRNVVKISANYMVDNLCAITDNGWAYCWGWNNHGQLGNGSSGANLSSNTPVRVGNLTDVTDISIASYMNNIQVHACAVSGGNAYCWGSNNHGQLGTGNTTNHSTPQQVGGALEGRTVESIGVGSRHTCALTTEPRVYCWGLNDAGQLGIGASGGDVTTPGPITEAAGVLQGRTIQRLDVGGNRGCVIADARNFCWGLNDQGQIGDGTQDNALVPTPSRFLDDLNPPLYW